VLHFMSISLARIDTGRAYYRAGEALSGLVFLREHLSVTQWLALVLVSAASAGAALTARRVPPPVDA
jgi:multidrug transporter EmrE-like cation transporter